MAAQKIVKDCKRCGGSGLYSIGICFKCQGNGWYVEIPMESQMLDRVPGVMTVQRAGEFAAEIWRLVSIKKLSSEGARRIFDGLNARKPELKSAAKLRRAMEVAVTGIEKRDARRAAARCGVH